jgi:ribose transport system permease protein
VSISGSTSTPKPAAEATKTRRRVELMPIIERAGVPMVAVLMFLYFAFVPSTGSVFLSSANLHNVLRSNSVTGIVAIAMIIPLAADYFDLSVAAVASVANIICAALIGTHGWPIWAGIMIPVVVAALLGVCNGFLVAKLRLNGFIVTLGTYTLLTGLIELYTKGQAISNGIPASLGSWGGKTWFLLPNTFMVLVIIAFVVWYILMQIPFGRHLEAIGANESAARLVGIDIQRSIWISFITSATVAGVAGVLQTAEFGGADPSVARGLLFPALTAVFLGATMIRPGVYNVFGTIIGVYFVGFSVSGFVLLGADVWVQSVFNGVALVVAVALATFMSRRRESLATPDLGAAEPQGDVTAGQPPSPAVGSRVNGSGTGPVDG